VVPGNSAPLVNTKMIVRKQLAAETNDARHGRIEKLLRLGQ
jgi:hypothetical protein